MSEQYFTSLLCTPNDLWTGISICFLPKNQSRPGGVVVYQYTRKKFAKIPKNTQNYTQVYFIPEIQRKWYTEYPYLSCNIPYTRFKKPLYTVYPKTLAGPKKLYQIYCDEATEKDSFFLCIYWDSLLSKKLLSLPYSDRLKPISKRFNLESKLW